MAENSEISWTDHTHNEWIGCTRVSPGCQHCYAETLMDTRYGRVKWGKGQPRVLTSEANRKKPLAWNRAAERARKLWAQCGAVGSPPARPRVFSASLSDWLDHEVDPAWLAGLLATVEATPELDWLLLSKRPQLWRERLGAAADARTPVDAPGAQFVERWLAGDAPPNVWVGTTVEDQQRADERIPALLEIPARVSFLSCEPLLSAVDLGRWLGPCDCDDECGCSPGDPNVYDRHRIGDHGRCEACQAGRPGIDWIIAGGESGHGARPMHPAWARSLRDQATSAGVAFHFKQWGEHAFALDEPANNARGGVLMDPKGDLPYWTVGKKTAGRLLDGREWSEFPGASP